MAHREFLLLNDAEQAEFVQLKGVRVADYEDGIYRYILYQIDSFYLECKLEIATGEILGIYSFTSTQALDKYTDKIKLP